MSIRARLAALEKRMAESKARQEAAKPLLVTFCVMARVDEQDERFYTWAVTEPADTEARGAMFYGGTVTFYCASAEQFRALKAQYDAEQHPRIISVFY